MPFFLFYVFVNLDNKSGLNPSAPTFTSTGTSASYSRAVKGMPNDKGISFNLIVVIGDLGL